MAGKSDYLENKFLDWLLRGQAFTPPATVYVGLFTATPSDAGGGTEVVGGSYARVAVASSLVNWAGTQGPGTTTTSSGSNGQTSNNVAVTFPTSSASWGTVAWFGVFDAASGGNLLGWGTLGVGPQAVPSGNTPSFAPGTLVWAED